MAVQDPLTILPDPLALDAITRVRGHVELSGLPGLGPNASRFDALYLRTSGEVCRLEVDAAQVAFKFEVFGLRARVVETVPKAVVRICELEVVRNSLLFRDYWEERSASGVVRERRRASDPARGSGVSTAWHGIRLIGSDQTVELVVSDFPVMIDCSRVSEVDLSDTLELDLHQAAAFVLQRHSGVVP